MDAADDEDEEWDFEGMVSVDEVARLGLREILREVQQLCEIAG